MLNLLICVCDGIVYRVGRGSSRIMDLTSFKYSNYANLLLRIELRPNYRANYHSGYRHQKFIIIGVIFSGLGITVACMKWPGILYPNHVKRIVSIKLTYF